MIRRYNDRLGTVSVGPWWLRLTCTTKPFAYSLWCFRKRLLFKPINYGESA